MLVNPHDSNVVIVAIRNAAVEILSDGRRIGHSSKKLSGHVCVLYARTID